MEAITFELSGRTAFFKKPDVNSFAYFTYNNIHKIALLGMLGAIIGLGGYTQQKNMIEDGKEVTYPEFYEKLKDLKVSIIPLNKRGYFSKKIQVFNNSVGYASAEEGGNLIVREQWLNNPAWKIYLLNDGSVDEQVYNELKEYLKNRKCKYIPYLGKNDHPAVISECKVISINTVTDVDHIDSLFPLNKVELSDEAYDERPEFIFKEIAPTSLNKEHNFYEYTELCFTNLEVEGLNKYKDVYSAEGKIIAFF